ncbi:MAG: hypothetical protein U1F43_07645 [Myxococcota bacterium]
MGTARSFALVDLYFPAHAAPPEDVLVAADAAGLDAVVLVAEHLSELPSAETLAALAERGRCRLYAACAVTGAGFRFVLLTPNGFDGLSLESIEASGDPKVVQAAAHALGGVAVPVSPRQSSSGEVARKVPPLPSDPVGVVALVAAGSRLGRDLDIEDAGIAERRIFAATGPFGTLAELGRYATVLPAQAGDLATIVGALQRGLGTGIELGPRKPKGKTQARPQRPPSPFEGREAEAAESADGEKKKRRRRRRGKKPGEGGGESSAAAAEGGGGDGGGDAGEGGASDE